MPDQALSLADLQRRRDAIRVWLWIMAALVVLMVLVGGATRLTDSGLSITEWRPVTGILPPLTQVQWLAEFEKYRQIPQYELINKGMNLEAFKTIYWWEWGHRFLGRLIGFAFFIPLVWFTLRGYVERGLGWRLWGLLALGGLQGAIGWLMVASGLKPGMIAVAPVKLTLHLTLACVILAALIWVAVSLKPRTLSGHDRRLAGPALLLAVLVLVQIALGALVAGNDAGLVYNTWPLMDGYLVPPADRLFFREPWVENFVDSHILVQFNHRIGAYLLLAVALWHAVAAHRMAPGSAAARRARVIAGLVVVQAGLGIATLLLAVPLWAGLAHQGLAVVLLAMAFVHARALRPAFAGMARPFEALAKPA
jgi:cytochrome c oxidase assembly protein subunit 15